jgi:hypothetical protein
MDDRCSIPDKDKILFSIASTLALEPTQSIIKGGAGDYIPGSKAAGA